MPNGKRVEYLDIAKGIGIILVVLGHVLRINPLVVWIYSFHMPLFFFVSGYIFCFNKTQSFSAFFVKKVRSILVPYAVFAVFFYLYWLLVEKGYRPGSINPVKPLIGIFYGIGKEPWLTSDDALWFLTCIFVLEIIFYFLSARVRSLRLLAVILIVSSVAGFFTGRYVHTDLPWGINIVFTAIVFFGAGYILHRCEIKYNLKFKRSFLYLPPLIALYIACTLFNGHVDMNTLVLNNYFLFYGAAFGGSLLVFFLSRMIGRCAFISFFGRNAIIILCVHEPVKRIVLGAAVLLTNIPLDTIRDSYLGAFVCTGVTILLIVPVIYLINNQLPFVLGRGRLRKERT